MPASDYVVLRDSNKDLEKEEFIDLTATIPTPPSVFDGRFSPILWFNIQPLTSHRLKFYVAVNDPSSNPRHPTPANVVLEYDSPDDIRLLRSIHEVIPVSLIKPGMVNTFRVFVADGSVRISDIVVSFHVLSF